MSARRSLAFLAALIFLLSAVPALAWDEAKLKAQAQELFDQAAASFAKKDVQGVVATSAPQATIKYRDGRTLNMTQWGEGVAKELADWQDVSSKFVVQKVWPKGKDKAGVLYTERHDFSRLSDPGHKQAIMAHFRAVLTKTPQGWRFLEFSELSIQLIRDGKPLASKAKPKQPAGPKTPAKPKAPAEPVPGQG
jgi:hypothetical protein